MVLGDRSNWYLVCSASFSALVAFLGPGRVFRALRDAGTSDSNAAGVDWGLVGTWLGSCMSYMQILWPDGPDDLSSGPYRYRMPVPSNQVPLRVPGEPVHQRFGPYVWEVFFREPGNSGCWTVVLQHLRSRLVPQTIHNPPWNWTLVRPNKQKSSWKPLRAPCIFHFRYPDYRRIFEAFRILVYNSAVYFCNGHPVAFQKSCFTFVAVFEKHFLFYEKLAIFIFFLVHTCTLVSLTPISIIMFTWQSLVWLFVQTQEFGYDIQISRE